MRFRSRIGSGSENFGIHSSLELYGLGLLLESESGPVPANWNPGANSDPEFILFTELESGKIRLVPSVMALFRQDFLILIWILTLVDGEK